MGCGGISSWSSSPARILRMSAACSIRSSRVVAKKRPLGMAPRQWPARPTRCMATATARVVRDLADEIDVADVDAELERCGGDEDLDLAVLQALLGVEAERAGERAVVRGDVLRAEALGEGEGYLLDEAACVDEDQRGAMVLRVCGELVEDLVPHVVGGDGAELVAGDFDGEIELAALADLDDGRRLAGIWTRGLR